MSHFAKVKDGIVVDIMVAEPEFFETFVDSSAGEWIQTSYNTHGGKHYDENGNEDGEGLRKNFAGIGYTYDYARDAFYAPQPFPSWILNETTCLWKAPVAMPNDGQQYTWNEENQSWDLYTE